MTVRIARNLSLPIEAVTQTFGILAKRGMGKTYTAAVIAEEMIAGGAQVVAVDPIGVWWGLRSSADGKRSGLSVMVMGGEHGDVPLESTAGSVIAEFLVETGESAVLDLSLMRKGEQVRFMTDFAETLYRRNREPIHLILDEADAFAPQKPMRDQARMLGAVEDLVRRGRARGIGLTLVTQRSAVINKNVLSQVEVLVAMRMLSPQDRAAIQAWVQHHGDEERRDEMMTSLATLAVGEAWIWSPGWLDLFQRVKIRRRKTFDSSSTPKAGAARRQVRMAAVDLEALRDRIAGTIERAKEKDPRHLRRRIAQLEKELAAKPSEVREVPALQDGDLDRIRELLDRVAEVEAGLVRDLKTAAEALALSIGRVAGTTTPASSNGRPRPSAARPVPVAPTEGLTGPQQRVIDALAWWESFGVHQPTRPQLAFVAGYKPNGGTFNNYLGQLRNQLGLIEYPAGGTVSLTDVGRSKANPPEPATVEALHERVLEILSGPQSSVLQVVIGRGPDGEIQKADLAREAGYEPGGGTFNNYVGQLRTLGLVDYPRPGFVAGTSVLFPEAA